MNLKEAMRIRELVIAGSKAEELGGFRTEQAPSDKVGTIFLNTYLGDVLVKQEYVELPHAPGTADNPFIFATGVDLVPNAYYTYDEVRYVYMGTPGVATDWVSVMDDMVEF